jgi:hypothetical protein
VHPPCVRGIGRLALLSHTFSLPACETGHNLKEIFATPSLPEDAADHGAILQHAEIVLVWTNRRALEDDQRRQPGATRVDGEDLVDTDDTKTMGSDIGTKQKACSVIGRWR